MNIFRKILNETENSKINIIPDDEKDNKISNQISDIINWRIVKSKSDCHPIYGYPMGQILCRNEEEANEYIEKSEFKDCYLEDYHK